jgi:hypothetical protein
MSAKDSTALRRATNLLRDPSPHTTKTRTSATKAMRNPKKSVDPPLPELEGSSKPVGVGVDASEVVDCVLVEVIVWLPNQQDPRFEVAT